MDRLAGKPLALPTPGTSKPRRLSTAQWGPLTATADSDLFGRKGNRSSQCEHHSISQDRREAAIEKAAQRTEAVTIPNTIMI